MKRAIAIIIMLSFIIPLPARAGVVKDLDPVEKELLTPQKATEQKMTDDFMNEMKKPPASPKEVETKTDSNWWKWALGIAIVGGIAVAAGGHGGGGSSSSSSSGSNNGGSTGSETVSW